MRKGFVNKFYLDIRFPQVIFFFTISQTFAKISPLIVFFTEHAFH
jgi:hypothetical protein